MLDERFPPGPIDTVRWSYASNPNFTVTQNNGLTIAFAANVPSAQGAALLEATSHDVRAACVTSSLRAVPSAPNGYCRIGWRALNGDAVSWVPSSNELAAYYFVAATGTSVAIMQAPFDPVAHQIVRLREANGTFTFETSAMGDIFVPYATVTQPPFDPTTARLEISCSSFTNMGTTNAGMLVVGFATELVQ